jgi:hypothetical protein
MVTTTDDRNLVDSLGLSKTKSQWPSFGRDRPILRTDLKEIMVTN